MSHAMCSEAHRCQKPSGRVCIESGCHEPAGALWGPYWCPEHDRIRLDRVSKGFDEIVGAFRQSAYSSNGDDRD